MPPEDTRWDQAASPRKSACRRNPDPAEMRLEYFQMIDRIVAHGPAELPDTLTAEATVPEASTVFEGHFPGYPLVPGVLLAETMAQASGYLLLARCGFARMPFLAGVREAKFRSFVGPGTRLLVEASLVHDGSGYAVTAGRISVDGRRICDAELTLRIMDFPAPELATTMREQGARLGLPVPPSPMLAGLPA